MKSGKPVVDVIIPVCRPGEKYRLLLEGLERQTVRARQIIVMNTGREFYDETKYSYSGGIRVTHIDFDDFDHGRTRHEAILQSDADYCLLMTQDAVPYDEYLVEELLCAMETGQAAVAYARQLADKDCRVIERLAREFNYPRESRLKTEADISAMGIKAFFCSDVCAMYDRERYLKEGGFISPAIFNEDMIMAYRFLKSGYGVYYKAEAKVVHSHNYSNMQQLHRNFDLGVSQADHPEVFGGISSESEGIRYLKRMTKLLVKERAAFYIPYFYLNSAFRLLGYRLGKNYKRLPMWFVKKCSMNRNYWRHK